MKIEMLGIERSGDTKGMPEMSRSGHQYRFLSAGQLVASNDVTTASSELLNARRDSSSPVLFHAFSRHDATGNSLALPQALLQATRRAHSPDPTDVAFIRPELRQLYADE